MTRKTTWITTWIRLICALALISAVAIVGNQPPATAAPPRPPVQRVRVFNTAIAGNTDVLASDFKIGRLSALRITVALSVTPSVMNFQITDGSGTTIAPDLNSSVALGTGILFTFTFGVHPDFEYNIQFETGTTIDYLLVEEIQDGVL